LKKKKKKRRKKVKGEEDELESTDMKESQNQ